MSSSKYKKEASKYIKGHMVVSSVHWSIIPTDFVTNFLWVHFKHNVNYIVINMHV